jgi:hypothetical protein
MDGNLGVPGMLRGTFHEAFSQSRRLLRTLQDLRQSNQLAGAKTQCTLQTTTAALVFLPGSKRTEIIPPDLDRGLLRLG